MVEQTSSTRPFPSNILLHDTFHVFSDAPNSRDKVWGKLQKSIGGQTVPYSPLSLLPSH